MNKQETNEDDIQTKPLADLPVTDEHAEETKGGPFAYEPTFRGGIFVGN